MGDNARDMLGRESNLKREIKLKTGTEGSAYFISEIKLETGTEGREGLISEVMLETGTEGE